MELTESYFADISKNDKEILSKKRIEELNFELKLGAKVLDIENKKLYIIASKHFLLIENIPTVSRKVNIVNLIDFIDKPLFIPEASMTDYEQLTDGKNEEVIINKSFIEALRLKYITFVPLDKYIKFLNLPLSPLERPKAFTSICKAYLKGVDNIDDILLSINTNKYCMFNNKNILINFL